MDWASGHWPGIVHVCLDACVLFGVRGGALGQGNRHHGHRLQGPPGPLCPPQRGHMARHPLTDPDTIGRQFTQQPSSLTHRWWIHLLAWDRWNEINSSVISVFVCFLWRLSDPLTSGNNKDINKTYDQFYSALLHTTTLSHFILYYCAVLCCTVLCSTLYYCHLYSDPPSHSLFFTTVLSLFYPTIL